MTDATKDTLTVNLTLTAAPSSPRVSIVIEKTCTPSQLRLKASEATKIPLATLKLIFRGRLIANDDANVVDEYKLEDDCVLHCMGKPVTGQEAANTASANIAANTASAAAGSSVSFVPQPTAAATPSGGDPLQAALNTLRSSNSASVYLTAVTTLEKVLSNCVDKPMEEKYRTVKKQNAAFQKRLGGLQGGEAAMLACGFVLEGQGDAVCYVLHPSPEAWPKLVATKAKVSDAVTAAKSAAGTAPPPAPVGGGFGGASLPPVGAMGGGMPGMGAGGMQDPNMHRAVANMMQDPNAISSMLQNPMVRNMLQNDPRFANNPQMRQSLDALASNPQMLNQVSSMMSDPAMQAQMQSMMNSQGGGMNAMPGMNLPGMGAAPNAPAPANNTAPTNASGSQQNNTNSGGNNTQSDQEMTEEEMIAEAIQRSLRES